MAKITCPHCGFCKETASARLPDHPVKATCSKCKQSFVFRGGVPHEEPLAPFLTAEVPHGGGPRRKLPGIGSLFGRAWGIFKSRTWTLFGLYLWILVPVMVMVAILTVGRSRLLSLLDDNTVIIAIGSVSALLLLSIIMTWGMSAVILAAVDEELGILDALGTAWKRLGAFIWIFILHGFLLAGAYLAFIIPGIIFTVWFFFALFVFAAEGETGMNALLISREYVRGFWFHVVLRLFIFGLAASAVSILLCFIPWVGPLLPLLLVPYGLVFFSLVYRDLREAKRDVSLPSGMWNCFLWVGVGVLGFLLAPIVANKSPLFRSLPFYGTNMTLDWPKAPVPPGLELSGEPPLPEKLVEDIVEPVSLTRKDYDTLLNAETVDFESGRKTSVGPAALQFDYFWADEQSAHLRLRVRFIPLPNLELVERRSVKVIIDKVEGRKGSKLYDRDSELEEEALERVSLTRRENPLHHFEGFRDVLLYPDVREKEIVTIKGVLEIRLPEEIEIVDLNASMTDRKVRCAGKRVTLKGMAASEVLLEIEGNFNDYLAMVGYNRQGLPLSESRTIWRTKGGRTTLKKTFEGEVDSAKVIIAKDLREWKYPFKITTRPKRRR